MGGWKICLTNAPKFPVAVPEQRGENEDLRRIGTSTIFVSYSFAGRAVHARNLPTVRIRELEMLNDWTA